MFAYNIMNKRGSIMLKCDELRIENACVYGPDAKVYLAERVDAVIAELKAEIKRKEGVGKRWFDRCMEARAENVKLKRALWLVREWRAWCEGQFWLFLESDKPRDIYHLLLTNRIHRTPNEWTTYWHKVEQLCEKKAEEYK